MQDLQYYSSTPRNDGTKYMVKFCSKIEREDHWFSIVMPVNASDIACVRWCSVITIADIRKPRSHPVTIVKIPIAIIYVGDITNDDVDNALNLPSEWSPSRPRGQPRAIGQFFRGCRRQVVHNLVLCVPRRYNMQDPNANRVYFHCSFEHAVNSDVIDLTAVDSDVSDDDASNTSDGRDGAVIDLTMI
jgi:hypothetical protein